MVYIINAHECHSHPLFNDLDLIKRRNILFTSITRSKAWVRVFGYGERMHKLIKEFDEVKNKNFELHFTYPSPIEINEMNLIRRDLSSNEEQQKMEEVDVLNSILPILSKIKSGDSRIEEYPGHVQEILTKLIEK
jgi:superfamily I DNA and RNA helicase